MTGHNAVGAGSISSFTFGFTFIHLYRTFEAINLLLKPLSGLVIELDIGSFQVVCKLRIACVVRSETKTSGITVNYGSKRRHIAVHKTVNAISYPYRISSDNNSNFLALFYCAYFVDRCHKDCAIDTRTNQKGFHIWIDVNVAFFTACYAHLAAVVVVGLHLTVHFSGYTFIEVVKLEQAFVRFNRH